MSREKATRYGASEAHLEYAGQDRSDIQFAVPECSRGMSTPTVEDQKSLKRLARYLAGTARAVQKLNWQNEVNKSRVWSHECKVPRKSTRRGEVQLGNHVVKSWSSTQQVLHCLRVTLSITLW